jgi:hypothetical protein
MFVWPYVRPHILCTQLVFCRILFIFGILVSHGLSMRILYRFHRWLIFARVVALFMTNMKRATTLAKINHPWNRYNMHLLRSWPTKIPNMNKMRQKTSCVHKMCGRTYVLDFIHIWYLQNLGWPWSEDAHIIPISRMVDFCESYSPFHICLRFLPQ